MTSENSRKLSEIKTLIVEGWRPRIKTVKGEKYLVLSKGREDKGFGRLDEELWNAVSQLRSKEPPPATTQLFLTSEEQQALKDIVKTLPSRLETLGSRLKELTIQREAFEKLEERVVALESQRIVGFDAYLEAVKLKTADGEWKSKSCIYNVDGYCDRSYWDQFKKPTFFKDAALPHNWWPGISYKRAGKSSHMKKLGPWRIRAGYWVCGLCGVYRSSSDLGTERLDAVTKSISELRESLKKLPIYNLYDDFKCSRCGSQHLVAVNFKCTKCGYEDWWGYHPKP